MSAGDAEEKTGEQSQWTRVSRKGKGKRSNRQTKSVEAPPPVAGAPEHFLPNPTPQLSIQDIRANHGKIATKWRSTAGYSKLCEIIKANAASHAPITRAICLGLGAFDPEDGSWVAQRRSHIQMAAFLAIVGTLNEVNGGAEMKSNTHIECFYQDPRFAQPDKDFIASLHGKIVESPDSYRLVDETTLVFGVHLYRDIWADALQRSLPGMFVGTGWDVWEQTTESEKNSDFHRIREMDASFTKLLFPQDGHDSFSSTCIYWKKELGDEATKPGTAASESTKDDSTSSTEPLAKESKDATT